MITDNLREQFATVETAYEVDSVADASFSPADKLLKSARVTNGIINEKQHRIREEKLSLYFVIKKLRGG